MRISELIRDLTSTKQLFGDLDIILIVSETEEDMECKSIEVTGCNCLLQNWKLD